MKSFALTFKHVFSQKADIFKSETKHIDMVLALEVMLIVLIIFLKLYVNGLYVSEKSKIGELRYKIKSIESDTKRFKVELAKYKDKERLNGISKLMSAGENIEVVVVR